MISLPTVESVLQISPPPFPAVLRVTAPDREVWSLRVIGYAVVVTDVDLDYIDHVHRVQTEVEPVVLCDGLALTLTEYKADLFDGTQCDVLPEADL